MKTKHSRATIKRIIKAHAPDFRQQKNLDLLVFLDYVLFLKDLAGRAEANAKAAGDKSIRGAHINAVAQASLKRFRA